MADAGVATAGFADAATPAPAPAVPDDTPSLRKVLGFALMAIGMFMAVLDIQIVAASLGQIQAGLAASESEISWVQTSYLVAEVVMIPLSGFLMRALGPKNLFVISSAGFTLSSLLCATATTLNEMIVYRWIQGFIGGAMIPVAFAASLSFFPRRYKTQVTVVTALLVTAAPTIGPTVGGLLTDAFSWHWIFLVNILPGTLVTFGVIALVDWGKPDLRLLSRIDILGLVLMALFFGGLDYVLEEGARNTWFEDETIVAVSILTAFAGLFFVWRNFASDEPIVDLSAFRNLNFAFGCTLQFMLGVALFGLTYAYPVYLGRVAGYSSSQIGETVFVTGATMMLLSPVAGRVARRTDPRLICSAGFLLLAASSWLTREITIDWRFAELLWPQILRGAGLICLIVSTTTIAFAALPPSHVQSATPLFILMRNIGGAAGLALVNTLIIERGYLHWQRMIETLNMGRADIAERMQMMTQLAESRGLDPDAAPLRMLAMEVQRQGLVMSLADSFYILTFCFVALAIVPHFLTRPPTFEEAPEAH